ncbi:hypothetical protein [Paraburkholderia xenovorans]
MKIMNLSPRPDSLNPVQIAILQDFAAGDFRVLTDCFTEDAWREELDRCGDGLLHFLLAELSRREDCLSLGEAARRIETAIADLANALAIVQSLPEWDEGRNASGTA